MRRLLPPVVALALAACSAAGGWTKAGADAEATGRAYRQCEALAGEAVKSDVAIDRDILATRSSDWQRAGVMPVQSHNMRESNRGHADAVIASCMQAQGFSRPR